MPPQFNTEIYCSGLSVDELESTYPQINIGSTAVIRRYWTDVVIKYLHQNLVNVKVDHHQVEKQIYEILGLHARINKFPGSSQEPWGLLFVEANRGNLQDYIDSQIEAISIELRLKWRLQAAESIAYIHCKGVIHSDLIPENFLLHPSGHNEDPTLLLCDFGGSCRKTGDGEIDGLHLPDAGFFNPRNEWVTTEDTDIFALAPIFYTIMTGHWLYRPPGGRFGSSDASIAYTEKADKLFMNQEFPSVQDLIGGDIIRACWFEEIKDAQRIVSYHENLIRERGLEGFNTPRHV